MSRRCAKCFTCRTQVILTTLDDVFHFSDEENKAERSEVTFAKCPSYLVVELRMRTQMIKPRAHAHGKEHDFRTRKPGLRTSSALYQCKNTDITSHNLNNHMRKLNPA
jgi:hypothetical protein